VSKIALPVLRGKDAARRGTRPKAPLNAELSV